MWSSTWGISPSVTAAMIFDLGPHPIIVHAWTCSKHTIHEINQKIQQTKCYEKLKSFLNQHKIFLPPFFISPFVICIFFSWNDIEYQSHKNIAEKKTDSHIHSLTTVTWWWKELTNLQQCSVNITNIPGSNMYSCWPDCQGWNAWRRPLHEHSSKVQFCWHGDRKQCGGQWCR